MDPVTIVQLLQLIKGWWDYSWAYTTALMNPSHAERSKRIAILDTDMSDINVWVKMKAKELRAHTQRVSDRLAEEKVEEKVDEKVEEQFNQANLDLLDELRVTEFLQYMSIGWRGLRTTLVADTSKVINGAADAGDEGQAGEDALADGIARLEARYRVPLVYRGSSDEEEEEDDGSQSDVDDYDGFGDDVHGAADEGMYVDYNVNDGSLND